MFGCIGMGCQVYSLRLVVKICHPPLLLWKGLCMGEEMLQSVLGLCSNNSGRYCKLGAGHKAASVHAFLKVKGKTQVKDRRKAPWTASE